MCLFISFAQSDRTWKRQTRAHTLIHKRITSSNHTNDQQLRRFLQPVIDMLRRNNSLLTFKITWFGHLYFWPQIIALHSVWVRWYTETHLHYQRKRDPAKRTGGTEQWSITYEGHHLVEVNFNRSFSADEDRDVDVGGCFFRRWTFEFLSVCAYACVGCGYHDTRVNLITRGTSNEA